MGSESKKKKKEISRPVNCCPPLCGAARRAIINAGNFQCKKGQRGRRRMNQRDSEKYTGRRNSLERDKEGD